MVFVLTIVITVVVVFLSWWLKIYFQYSRHLNGFPHPRRFLFFGNALDSKSTTDFIPNFAKYKELHGDVIKLYIGLFPSKLLISDRKFIEYILSSTNILNKGKEYQYLSRWLGKGLLISNGDNAWKRHRRIIGKSFSKQIFEDFLEVFELNANTLVEKLTHELDNPSVNIYNYIRLCTLDIICEAAMRSPINAQSNAENDYVKSVKTMCQLFITRVFNLFLRNDTIYKYSNYYKDEIQALTVINNYSNGVIEKRRKSFLEQNNENYAGDSQQTKKLALLDLLLQESEINNTLPFSHVKEEVETFLFAGHDTSTSATSFAIFCLAQNPRVQSEVVEELYKIFGNDITRPVTLQDINQMKYLDAVLKETLRLYPPVPYFSRQISEQIEYDGHVLPKGLSLLLNIYGLHHDPKHFPEPEMFIPERFLDENSKRLPYTYLPFSAGSRNCIGQNFAMLEMKTILSILLRHYELLPSVPQHNIILSAEVVLESKNGIRIQIKKRKWDHTMQKE